MLLGGAAAAWPLAARAQQAGVPVVGFLHPGVPERSTSFVDAFRKGLSETGHVEGRNVAIEYRWAQNNNDRLSELTADLVRRRVAVIAALTAAAALPAKAATTTIPVVFTTAGDPVESGLVTSLNRPGGNVTGYSVMSQQLAGKRLGVLHELMPHATRFALLVNPNSPNVQAETADARAAAATIGRELQIFTASTNAEIDSAFANLVQRRVEAVIVSSQTLFLERRAQLLMLSARHALPTMFSARENVEAGALIGYGPDVLDQYRQAGLYVGRILKGEKPADLPVMRPTKFELVINLQTAKLFGIEVPQTLLVTADELIK
jgi:putative tryptophan/tyrosine transport system substrate-binding protein